MTISLAGKLRRQFERTRKAGMIPLAACREGERLAEGIKPVDQLIREGHSPVHALYLNVHNSISLFVEEVTVLPMFKCAYSTLAKAQDMHTPGYPPMSPITVSYYGCWMLYDLRIGKDDETLGGCFTALSDLLELDALQIEAARNLCQSRMGIYAVLGASGAGLRLRELVTDHEFEAVITSGFKGRAGDLILIRLLPPVPECGLPWVGMTTPYVLVGCPEGDWLEAKIISESLRYARNLDFDPPPRVSKTLAALGPLDVADTCQQQIPLGGEEGIPSYMAGPHDDVEHIMATLNRTCGKGNFHFTIPTNPLPWDFFD